MKAVNQYVAGSLAVLAMLVSSAASAEQMSAQPVQKPQHTHALRKQHHQPIRPEISAAERAHYKAYAEDKMQARLNLWARQLGIMKNQQSAWNAYSQTLKQLAAAPYNVSFPKRNADAAAIAKFRADSAAQRAQYLANVSQATSQLQSVLTAEQQTKFNQLSHFWQPGLQHGKHHGHRKHPGSMMHDGKWHDHIMDTCPYF